MNFDLKKYFVINVIKLFQLFIDLALTFRYALTFRFIKQNSFLQGLKSKVYLTDDRLKLIIKTYLETLLKSTSLENNLINKLHQLRYCKNYQLKIIL